MAKESISYQEVASAIAAILTRHPQFDRAFTEFENLPWIPIPRGMIKRIPGGGSMLVERSSRTGRLKIRFSADVSLGDC